MSDSITSRNTTRFIIEILKAQGVEYIEPSDSVRFLQSLVPRLPPRWQNLDRDGLIKQLRLQCELGAATSRLKRRRIKGIQGYVYQIIQDRQ